MDNIEQVVLAYGAESDRALGVPGEVCTFDKKIVIFALNCVHDCVPV